MKLLAVFLRKNSDFGFKQFVIQKAFSTMFFEFE